MPSPAHSSGGAETAPERAAVLRGETEGEPGRGRHVDRLDDASLGQLVGHLAGAAVRGLPSRALQERSDGELLHKPRAEGRREVGHGRKIGNAPAVDPFRDLPTAVWLFPEGIEELLQLGRANPEQVLARLGAGPRAAIFRPANGFRLYIHTGHMVRSPSRLSQSWGLWPLRFFPLSGGWIRRHTWLIAW